VRPARRTSTVAVVVGLIALVGACGGSTSDTEAFCAQVRRVPVITDRLQLASPDPTTASAELVDELERLRNAAPRAVRSDVAALLELSEVLATALTTTDDTTRAEALAELESRRVEWEEASSSVVAYTSRTCGIDLGG
jgi:hypothetical protein